MNNTLNAILEGFAPRPGVTAGVLPPVLRSSSPIILNNTTNLEHDPPIAYELSYNPTVCSPRYLILACDCGKIVRRKTCMSLECVTCQPALTRRRAVKAFKRLCLTTSPVIYTVFTVPFMERYRFMSKASWQEVRKRAWKLLRQIFGAEFGIESSHPVGDDSNEFHPHLNFLWKQREGLSPFIDVTMLREKWAAILGVSVSDVHTEYSMSKPKIMHWCKYALRTFPGFMHWCGSVRWYGKYPKLPKPEKLICAECGKPYHHCGYILESDYNEWNDTGWQTGIPPPWERDSCIMHT